MKFSTAVDYKLDILCSGISMTDSFINFYAHQSKFIEKRRAYGTGDSSLLLANSRAPQEIILDGKVIVAVNYNPDSKLSIDIQDGKPILIGLDETVSISFPPRPFFYDQKTPEGELLQQVITVYGNNTLGLFSPGHCYYFNDDRQCKFCSLDSARDTVSDHKMKIKRVQAAYAINLATSLEPGRYKRVLFNGGTIKDYDKGFKIHTQLMQGTRIAIDDKSLDYHLISMPPKDFKLFENYALYGDKLAMSLEVFDSKLFREHCPGKSQDYTRDRFIDAFIAAAQILGRGRVHVGFVAGLEPVDKIIEGLEFFGSLGVVPAVAVFHPDKRSIYQNYPRPNKEYLKSIGLTMQRIYRENNFIPLIEDSGRNSLDTEAYKQGFNDER